MKEGRRKIFSWMEILLERECDEEREVLSFCVREKMCLFGKIQK